ARLEELDATVASSAEENAPADAADALLVEQRELLERLAALRDRQTRLELELSLQGVTLVLDDEQRGRDEFVEKMAVRRQAYRIITVARRNIVTKVLPST